MSNIFQRATAATVDIITYPARLFFHDAKKLCKPNSETLGRTMAFAAVMSEMIPPASLTVGRLYATYLNGASPPTLKEVAILSAFSYVASGIIGSFTNSSHSSHESFEPFPFSRKYTQKRQQQTSQPG